MGQTSVDRHCHCLPASSHGSLGSYGHLRVRLGLGQALQPPPACSQPARTCTTLVPPRHRDTVLLPAVSCIAVRFRPILCTLRNIPAGTLNTIAVGGTSGGTARPTCVVADQIGESLWDPNRGCSRTGRAGSVPMLVHALRREIALDRSKLLVSSQFVRRFP